MSELAPAHEFIYPAERVINCAGVVPGDDVYTHERDMCARRRTAKLIQQMGIGLRCTQVVMNSAIIMMHRLFIFWPSHKLPLGKVAAACFLLAAKIEDCPRRLTYIVQQYFRYERQVVDIKQVSAEEMSHVGDEIVLLENLILPCLGFNLTITQPHHMLVRGCRALNLPRNLAQTAYYNCTNLLHLTIMVLRLRPETLAAACVQMAASWSNVDLPPASETDGKNWFNFFDTNMTPELLKAAVDECISEFTKVPPEAKQTLKDLTKATPTQNQLMQMQQRQMEKRQQDREMAAKAALVRADTVVKVENDSAVPASADSTAAASSSQQQQQASRPPAALTIDEYKKRRQVDAATASSAVGPAVASDAKSVAVPTYHCHPHPQQHRPQQQQPPPMPWPHHKHQNNHQHHSQHAGQQPVVGHHQHHHQHHHHRPTPTGNPASATAASVPPLLSGTKRPHHHLSSGGDYASSASAGDSNQTKKHKPTVPPYYTK